MKRQRASGLAAVLLGAALPAAAALPHSRVVDTAAAALFAGFAGPLGTLEARPLDGDDAAPDLAPPPGALRLAARLPAGAVPARRMVAYVDIAVDSRHWRTVPVWFAVQAWRPVWVARVPLAAGQAVQADALALERRDVAALGSAPLLPLPTPHGREAFDGLRLRAALPAGAVLAAANVEPRPAVVRNQPVQVQVHAGAVALRTGGIALADARIGDLVRVLNPSSRESYGARVVADGLVVAGGELR